MLIRAFICVTHSLYVFVRCLQVAYVFCMRYTILQVVCRLNVDCVMGFIGFII